MSEQFKQTIPDVNLEKKDKEAVLNINKINAILQEADLSKTDYEKEWGLEAEIYRELMWRMAIIFCEKQGWSPEITHSEYALDEATGKVKSLDLCMEFFEDKDDGERKGYAEFKTFLENNTHLIPQELRQKFEMYIGFNYDENGAIVISEKDIKLITQAVYEELQSDGMIEYASLKKEGAFGKKLNETIAPMIKK